MSENKKQSTEPIAIIGAACRFPGNANSLPEFWDLLQSGTDAVSSLPPKRFSLERFYSKYQKCAGHAYTTAAGVVEDICEFDPHFFGISRKEAMSMDPQQRLALQLTWEALENAHLKASTLRGSDTAVFMGASNMDYSMNGPEDTGSITSYSMTGTTLGVIPNRISYLFDFHGPSIMLDTACSSSLVAVHQACETLRQGQASLALAGGVNALLTPYPFIGFSRARMLSPDGRCKVFDASGNGYVRSEGGGIVILKPLSAAIKDKNLILGIVAASGVNSDGRTTGIALPNQKAQEALLRRLYADFNLDITKLVYVEAHGTGTAAGDPLEAAAIGNVLGKNLKTARPLYVGSVKSNIGHLEPASGIAGLIKSLLIFDQGRIPPNLHLETPNPAIDFEDLNITIPTTIQDLPEAGGEELISINSFGFGGTNAHVVLQRPATPRKRLPKERAAVTPPLFLSAKSSSSLAALAGEYHKMLEQIPEGSYYDLAATLAQDHEHHAFRAALTGETPQEVLPQLKKLAKNDATFTTRETAESLPAPFTVQGGVFAFSGNGSQWVGMGQGLLASSPEFRSALEEIDMLFARHESWSLVERLLNADTYKEELELTEKSQPLLFAVQVGLVEALRSKGILPSAVLGHSVGEVAAAWACGALSLEDAVTVIHYRSVHQAPLRNRGGMAVANMTEEAARELLKDYPQVSVAAVNTSASLTLAGPIKDLRSVVEICKGRRVAAKMLPINYPFHTAVMDEFQEQLVKDLAAIQPRKPKIPFFSTALPGKKSLVLDADYWWRNVRQPVLFAAAARNAWDKGFHLFLEIGPSPVLRSYLRDIFKQEKEPVFVAPTLARNKSEAEELDAAWKNAWRHGWNLDFSRHFPHEHAKTSLPRYTWDNEYLWGELTSECRDFLTQDRLHPLLGWMLPGKASIFENMLHPADYPWLADHVAGNGALFPAAAFIETMLAAAEHLRPGKQQELEWISIFRPLPLSPETPRVIRVSVDQEDGGLLFEGRPHSSAEGWSVYARGRIQALADAPALPPFPLSRPETFGLEIDKSALYDTARRFSLHYGPAFQTVEKAWLKADADHQEILARLQETDPTSKTGMLISPAMLDGAFQTLFMLLGAGDSSQSHTYLPSVFEKITLYKPGTPRYAHTRMERISPRSVVASFSLLDEAGNTLLQLRNARFRRASWLEHEQAPSRPYAMMLHPSGHPEQEYPLRCMDLEAVSTELSGLLAKEFAPLHAHGQSGMNPYLLLQFTALRSMYEAVEAAVGSQDTVNGFTVAGLLRSGSVAPSQEAWFRRMLHKLADAGLAVSIGESDAWRLERADNQPEATLLWSTLVSTSSGALPEATLLAHIFRNREALLRGAYADREDAILSARHVDAYFINSMSLQPFARTIRRVVSKAMHAGDPEQPLQILQLARNTEAVLFHVLPLLDACHCTYVVGEKDDSTAEARSLAFNYHPNLDFVGIDPEKPASEHVGRYQLILIAHSLHRRVNSAAALAGCFSMLAPGGTLCFVEHGPSLFTDFVFGSRPWWWEASSDATQPVSLMQGMDYWQTQLRAAGFSDLTPVDNDYAADSPAFILLARKEACTLMEDPAPLERHEEPEALDGNAAGEVPLPGVPEKAPHEGEHWVLVAGKTGTPGANLAHTLHEALSATGRIVELVLRKGGKEPFDPACPDHWQRLLRHPSSPSRLNVVYLAGYDHHNSPESAALASTQQEGLNGLAALGKAWDALRLDVELWVVSGGGLAASSNEFVPNPSQGALCGFTRVMMNEFRSMSIRLVDIHGDDSTPLGDVIFELLHPTPEREIVLAGGSRFVPRLSAIMPSGRPLGGIHPEKTKSSKTGALLVFDEPGRLQNLYWKEMDIPLPGANQVCIEVKNTGLNFRDVMWSMGMLQDEALENGFSGPTMGIECSGVITAVGSEVQDWQPGDAVLCFAPACFGTHVLTDAAALARKPASLGFAEAATIPVAFITAWYSLKHQARLQKGERVLIHGAAGGVGLAAVQIASLLGLEIYATAGAPEKHNFLRQMGVKHIFSSRSAAFAQEVMQVTNGEGVDAVLNSLAGEFISAGLSVLRPFGRFIELGKRDFYADTPMRLRPFSNNLSYFGVDVDQLLIHQPRLAHNLFAELISLFEERKLVPLPHTVYPAFKTVDAFQAMQQSAHIGKLVISLEGAELLAKPEIPDLKALHLEAEASYLVTGGTGGFGLATARHLVHQGAKNLILLSRGGVRSDEAKEVVTKLKASGVKVVVGKTDVADAESLSKTLKKLLKDLPPLRGVIHAATAMDDGMINGLTPDRIATVLGAKSLGAWNLHEATLQDSLDFFVLYSSATTPFGNPGQASYVAANCMLEALAAWRRKQGLPAQCIGWGPIGDSGMLLRNPKARQMLLKVLGISPTSTAEAMRWLENVVAEDVASSHYFGIDWDNRADLPVLRAPRFSWLRSQRAQAQGSSGPSLDDIKAAPPKEALEMITQVLMDEVAHVLRLPKDKLAPELPLVSLGMDSLTSVELGLAVEQRFEFTGYTLPLSEKTTAGTLAESLYAILCGGEGEAQETESLKQAVHTLAEKHGVAISEVAETEIADKIH